MIVPITAIIPAFQRIQQTLVTLKEIQDCEPYPDEIIVHVDGNQTECEKAIQSAFPDVKLLRSETSIGPGGGRNKLIQASQNEIVASFDDDSYPIDADYFARVQILFDKFPDASILCAAVYHQGESIEPDSKLAMWVADFIGCGCIYRRTMFLAKAGYVPLTVAYGMEEVDMALRLHEQGGKVLKSPWLRVFHDTDLKRHADPCITAGSIANLALLAYLRYPISLWPFGAAQCLNRIQWLLKHGRTRGILRGIGMMPAYVYSHRRFRQPLRRATVRSFVKLRRRPVPVEI